MAARPSRPPRPAAGPLTTLVALDSVGAHLNRPQLPVIIMGQQLNKHIKRKRRAAYLKRRKERAKAAGKKK